MAVLFLFKRKELKELEKNQELYRNMERGKGAVCHQ